MNNRKYCLALLWSIAATILMIAAASWWVGVAAYLMGVAFISLITAITMEVGAIPELKKAEPTISAVMQNSAMLSFCFLSLIWGFGCCLDGWTPWSLVASGVIYLVVVTLLKKAAGIPEVKT